MMYVIMVGAAATACAFVGFIFGRVTTPKSTYAEECQTVMKDLEDFHANQRDPWPLLRDKLDELYENLPDTDEGVAFVAADSIRIGLDFGEEQPDVRAEVERIESAMYNISEAFDECGKAIEAAQELWHELDEKFTMDEDGAWVEKQEVRNYEP